ncbi:RICIN domain-containing protein [Streptomyces rimosus]|uniref:RICIN domain-containing protein n=1 Tax=Streptomyces TaxID=1883 RepID=UPI00051817EA|nr:MULTISPECIES: RICIN domain-containing protein [Streptomyces]RSO47806.1 hypothetical protein DMH15_05495 [Streptomyces sp. WAC 06725]
MKFSRTLGVAAAAVALIGISDVTANASGSRFIKSVYSDKCAGVGSEWGNGAPVIQWTCNPNARDQSWLFVPTTDANGARAYFLKNDHSGKCMGVGSELGNGAPAIQYSCNGSVDEKWWYANGVFRNVYSGKCLGTGSEKGQGARLIQWSCNGAVDELFAISPGPN